MNLVRLNRSHDGHTPHDSTHALHTIRMARIRREHHKSDLPLGKEVDREMPIPISLPLAPERRRRRDGDHRAPEIGRGPQEEEHLPRESGEPSAQISPFLFERTE